MKLGTVILFNHENGYGIIRDDRSNKYFFCYGEIQTEGSKPLQEGQRVSFDVEKCQTGFAAANVKVIYRIMECKTDTAITHINLLSK